MARLYADENFPLPVVEELLPRLDFSILAATQDHIHVELVNKSPNLWRAAAAATPGELPDAGVSGEAVGAGER